MRDIPFEKEPEVEIKMIKGKYSDVIKHLSEEQKKELDDEINNFTIENTKLIYQLGTYCINNTDDEILKDILKCKTMFDIKSSLTAYLTIMIEMLEQDELIELIKEENNG